MTVPAPRPVTPTSREPATARSPQIESIGSSSDSVRMGMGDLLTVGTNGMGSITPPMPWSHAMMTGGAKSRGLARGGAGGGRNQPAAGRKGGFAVREVQAGASGGRGGGRLRKAAASGRARRAWDLARGRLGRRGDGRDVGGCGLEAEVRAWEDAGGRRGEWWTGSGSGTSPPRTRAGRSG
jgi:hypothetical protein